MENALTELFMEHHRENQLVQRIARLVQQNKELSEELKKLQEEYNFLFLKNEENEQLIHHFHENKETPEKPRPVKFNMVTILFANIHSFSEIMPQLPDHNPQLIDQLDQLFIHFDEIISKYPIAKIKTIGDSYMCAGGIPDKNITNPVEIVLAAFEMLQCAESFFAGNGCKQNIHFAVHTGPVSAFTNGKVKVTYDIKGDTVNTVSRLESCGTPGKVLISVMTYELVKEFFDCEYYGKLPVKYTGLLDIYAVKGIKPELSIHGKGQKPSEDFRIKFSLIRFHDLQELILDMLEQQLPKDLYYHNLKHTVDVVTEVELIGLAEGLTDEQLLIVKTAALFHDAGHIHNYEHHEAEGARIAREILPAFHYSEKQIEEICKIIMATKIPPLPKNLLEEIICDADLDYLGRVDFIPVSNTLYEELKIRNKVGTLQEWNKQQLKFISGHQYFTRTAGRLREVNKQNQIERIRNLLN